MYTCSKCSDSYVGDYAEATGHKAVTDAAVAPTATESGLTEGTHCEVCGEILTAQEEIPPTGETITYGDMNKNGQIDVQDALEILKAYVGLRKLDEEEQKIADVSGNGEIEVEDALYVLKYYVELIEVFPVDSIQ